MKPGLVYCKLPCSDGEIPIWKAYLPAPMGPYGWGRIFTWIYWPDLISILHPQTAWRHGSMCPSKVPTPCMIHLSSRNQPNARYYFKHIPSYSFSGWYSRGILPSHFVWNGIPGLQHPHSLDGTFWRLLSPKLTVRPLKICQNPERERIIWTNQQFSDAICEFQGGYLPWDETQTIHGTIVYLPIHLPHK